MELSKVHFMHSVKSMVQPVFVCETGVEAPPYFLFRERPEQYRVNVIHTMMSD